MTDKVTDKGQVVSAEPAREGQVMAKEEAKRGQALKIPEKGQIVTGKGQVVRIGWLLGWGVPEGWFAPMARAVFPFAVHTFAAAVPGGLDGLAGAGPFDWVAGYSLGTLLMLGEVERVAGMGRVALLAPIFGFPIEANRGGRISRTQVRQLARQLRRDPGAALADFYRRAGLDVSGAAASAFSVEDLLWGLECLEGDGVPPPLPKGWLAWCGEDDPLLDAGRLHAIEPRVAIVAGANHHPLALLGEFSAATRP
jgi:hypothetical protein